MGVVVRRYIDILIIIINFSTPLVLALFLAAVSLLHCSFFKCFFVLVYVIFVQYSKRCSKNNRDRSKIEITRTWRYNYINKNVRRLRVRESRDFDSTCEVPRDVSRKLQLTSCAIMDS